MALRRKRRRFRFGLPELTGIFLLCATIALGVQWALEQNQSARMLRTTGRIVEVIGDDSAAPRIHYTYTVNGLRYSNVTRPDIAGRTLASLLPASIMAQLTEYGIFDFEDLPEEARRQIREGTEHTFDELNEADRRALQNHGYQNAEQLRVALLGAMDGNAAPAGPETSSKRLTLDVSIPVLYDPKNPAKSSIATDHITTQHATLASLTPFFLAATLTCAYFAGIYPRIKRRNI